MPRVDESLYDSGNGGEAARARMRVAQCTTSISFSNALLGICHSLAHRTGHSSTSRVAAAPPSCFPVIEFNTVKEHSHSASIGRCLGLPGQTDRQQVNSLVEAIQKLNRLLGIKQSHKENGVPEEECVKVADFIAKEAVGDPCTASSPRETSVEGKRKVLDCAFFGRDVKF